MLTAQAAAHPHFWVNALAGQEKGDPGASSGLWNRTGGVRRDVHSMGDRLEVASGGAHACVLALRASHQSHPSNLQIGVLLELERKQVSVLALRFEIWTSSRHGCCASSADVQHSGPGLRRAGAGRSCPAYAHHGGRVPRPAAAVAAASLSRISITPRQPGDPAHEHLPFTSSRCGNRQASSSTCSSTSSV